MELTRVREGESEFLQYYSGNRKFQKVYPTSYLRKLWALIFYKQFPENPYITATSEILKNYILLIFLYYNCGLFLENPHITATIENFKKHPLSDLTKL